MRSGRPAGPVTVAYRDDAPPPTDDDAPPEEDALEVVTGVVVPIDRGRPRAPRRERVPPHDLDAEEALLGAMLLGVGSDYPPYVEAVVAARAAIGAASDFYGPAMGRLWSALEVVGSGDVVLLRAELARTGHGDDAAEIGHIMAECPAVTNAARYAARVAETAAQRRRLGELLSATEATYEGDEDAATAAVGRASAITSVRARAVLEVEDLSITEPEMEPAWLHRSDGSALIYPGLLHWIAGVPASGKTWMALLATLSAVRAGRSAVYLDYEGSRRIVGGRLRALGATAPEMQAIAYVRPSGGSGRVGPSLVALAGRLNPAIVVLDGVAKSMARDGADEDRAADVLAWMEAMVWPATAGGDGAAALLLDHVTKDVESRGRWMRGSGAKLGEVDGAAYSLEIRQPWSRAKDGYSAVRLVKDREGVIGANDEVVGLLRFKPLRKGLDCAIEVVGGSGGRDTSDIEAVLLRVVGAMEPGVTVSQRGLEALVRDHGSWRSTIVRDAAQQLAEQGRIGSWPGSRGARLYGPLATPGGSLVSDW